MHATTKCDRGMLAHCSGYVWLGINSHLCVIVSVQELISSAADNFC